MNVLKKSLIIFAILSIILFAGCKQNNNSDVKNSQEKSIPKESAVDTTLAPDLKHKQSTQQATTNHSNINTKHGAQIPSFDKNGKLINISEENKEKIEELLENANIYSDKNGYNFMHGDNIDEFMYPCGVMESRNIAIIDNEARYYVPIDEFQKNVRAVFANEIFNILKYSEKGNVYWSPIGFEESYVFKINEVNDLEDNYFLVKCQATYTDGIKDLSKKAYQAIVEKNSNAKYGYYLISQKFV